MLVLCVPWSLTMRMATHVERRLIDVHGMLLARYE
jgi:hypothetical protein